MNEWEEVRNMFLSKHDANWKYEKPCHNYKMKCENEKWSQIDKNVDFVDSKSVFWIKFRKR